MQRLHAVVIFLLSLTSCWAEVQLFNGSAKVSKTGQGTTSSKIVLKDVLNEIRQLKRNQALAERRSANVTLLMLSKILDLNRRLEAVSTIVEEYYQSLNSIFGHWVTAFVPKTNKKTTVDIPVCPINSCFEKLMLPRANVDSIDVLTKIKGVTSLEGCSLLCGSQPKCAGVYYNETESFCKLLTYQHSHVEPRGPLVAIWTRSGRGFGKCPSSFYIKWRMSRYKFVKKSTNWKQAESWCRRQSGSKLAELTSAEEIEKIGSNRFWIKRLKYWMVGGVQEKGSKEPDSGWKWYRSNITIPTDGFQWKNKQPDNYKNNEHFMNAQYMSGGIRFNDLEEKYIGHGFLCECIQLPS